MVRVYDIVKVDAFTEKPFCGNPAGIVFDADGLNDYEMIKIAGELNPVSETAFLFKEGSDKNHIRVRFFSPVTEISQCGHATIAMYFALEETKRMKFSKPRTTVMQEMRSGILPVDVYAKDGQIDYVLMTQGKLEFFNEDLDADAIANILGIRKEAITNTGYPLENVSTGRKKLMVPIDSLKTLGEVKPNFPAMIEYCRKVNTTGFHLFTFETFEQGSSVSTRHFAPIVGVNEDPVTGNSNAAMGAYLVKNKIFPIKPEITFISEQGYHMGRPGKLVVRIETMGEEITKVQVGGKAIVLVKGKLQI